MNMPWWAKFLLSIAIRYGVPELQKVVGPEVAKLIEGLLKLISGSTDQVGTVTALQTHFAKIETKILAANGRTAKVQA